MPNYNLNELKIKVLAPGIETQLVHTDTVSISYVRLKKGAILPLHWHVNEQISTIIEGELEFTVEGETTILKNGIVSVIPSNAKHSAIALTDCYIIDVFHPVREEYK